MTDSSQPVIRSTDAKDSLIFYGGRVYQVTPTRFRIEFGTSWREMEFDEWVSWLRYDRIAEDRKKFAAMAMQSVRAVNPACSSQEVAQSAVADADALLKELAK